MNKVERLLMRQEVDALEEDLFRAKRAASPESAHIEHLAAAIERLEARLNAARPARSESHLT